MFSSSNSERCCKSKVLSLEKLAKVMQIVQLIKRKELEIVLVVFLHCPTGA